MEWVIDFQTKVIYIKKSSPKITINKKKCVNLQNLYDK